MGRELWKGKKGSYRKFKLGGAGPPLKESMGKNILDVISAWGMNIAAPGYCGSATNEPEKERNKVTMVERVGKTTTSAPKLSWPSSPTAVTTRPIKPPRSSWLSARRFAADWEPSSMLPIADRLAASIRPSEYS